MIMVAMLAVGCSSPEEKKKYEEERIAAEAKAEQQKKNPIVTVVGTYDGCEVKHYDRGYYTESFFIAKCVSEDPSETTTMTSMQRVGGGKHTRYIPKLDISQEISAAEAEKKKMDKYIAEAKALKAAYEKKQAIIDSAKQKLSAEEREALNLK